MSGPAGQRVAVVAGAAGALGGAVVRRLLGDGWGVAAVVRAASAGRVPVGAVTLPCDLSDQAEVATLPARVAELGDWRACVVCSGGFGIGAAHETADGDLLAQLEINLLGPWRMARAAATSMLAAGGGGRIVLALSRAGVEVLPGQAAYQVSKAAATRLVEVMARELVDSGITVNGVLPSTMDTPANRAGMGDADAHRWVRPERVAGVVAWLCGDDTDDVSGALLPVYGRS